MRTTKVLTYIYCVAKVKRFVFLGNLQLISNATKTDMLVAKSKENFGPMPLPVFKFRKDNDRANTKLANDTMIFGLAS